MAVAVIAGVDEAGVGPLAGPVVAAAVVLRRCCRIDGLADSKMLSEKQRDVLAEVIKQNALSWAIGRAEVEEIDRINVLRAGLLAMRRAVHALATRPTRVLVDGIHAPDVDCEVRTIVRGDQTVAAISAASILAKVARDEEMRALHALYPAYDFASHKGYCTRQHLEALERHGPCPVHRRSFEPVRRLLDGN